MTRALLALVLLPALLLAQGPDQGGYRYIDSDTAAGPAFEWLDISGSGIEVELDDDDNRGPFPLGFAFDFYGHTYDSVRICSNGWLSFTSNSHQFHHLPIPDQRDPNALLAPLWADLDPSIGGHVYYLADTAAARFIVSWVNVPFYQDGQCTFQVILDSADNILFQYLSLPAAITDGTDSCSVGIEDSAGNIGLEYLHNGRPEGNLLHDSLAVGLWRPDRDLALTDILRPFESELQGILWFPTVRVHNYSRDEETFRVACRISGYSETITVTGLPALTATIVEFPAMSGAGTIEFLLQPCDSFPENDTLTRAVSVDTVGDLRHDDGTADTTFLRIGSPTRDWAALVKLPSLPHDCRLTGARVFVCDTLPFARVLVCPGDTAPNLYHPYLEAESVASAAPDTWLEVPADTLVPPGTPLWLVAFWPRGADGPRIGDDRSYPDQQSWFGSPTVRWIPYPDGDLMMRLRVNGDIGIAEHTPGSVPRLSARPNPFAVRLDLSVSGLEHLSVSGRVFDAAGRAVREFSVPVRNGTAAWAWSGCDDAGHGLPAGAYFITVRAGSRVLTSRVLLAR